MAEDKHRQEELVFDGTLVRGADGQLYMIPNEDMESYRVPDDLAGEANDAIDRADVEGISLRPQRLNREVTFLPALQGPLGRRDPVAGPSDPTHVAPIGLRLD